MEKETRGHLIKIERALSPIFKLPLVKTVWIANINDGEESEAYISVILDDTKRGCEAEEKKIMKCLRHLESSQKPKYVFNIYKLSEYWSRLVAGDSKLYSEMRLSIILYDPAGFFAPLKVLLLEGKIPCTRESAYTLLISAPEKVMRVRKEVMMNVLSRLYNLVVDAGQAPLILKGYDPPIPKKIPDELESRFSRSEVSEKDIEILRNIISYYKDVEHGKIGVISSKNIHIFLEASEEFIKDMERLMARISR